MDAQVVVFCRRRSGGGGGGAGRAQVGCQDLVPGFSEQELREVFEEAFGERHPVRFVGLACDESPCVAAFWSAPGVNIDAYLAQLPPFRDGVATVWRTQQRKDGFLLVRVVSDRTLEDKEHLEERVEALGEAVADEVFAP